MIEPSLLLYMKELLQLTSDDFHRYKFHQIDWNLRLSCLVGARGTGKTTMILQHIKATPNENPLYVSADHSYFTNHTLIELADDFIKEGGDHLYIDEIHKYEGWSREIKQIYDTHPNLKVFITGSSVLDLLEVQADLSRRMVMTQLYGMSFREYLKLVHHIQVPTYTLSDILTGKALLPDGVHPLPLFRQYLQTGYYPFTMEGAYLTRLEQVIRQTLELDIPQYAKMTPATARKLRRMLSIVAQSAPYKPDAQALAGELGISRNDVPNYLLYMEKAGMISQLRDNTGGMRGLGKVEKVYLDNTNMQYALVGEKADLGSIRETFFYNQTQVVSDVIVARKGDFCIHEYTFEVGGKNKTQKQIADVPNAYVVRDDIEYAAGNILPLWAFGLLY